MNIRSVLNIIYLFGTIFLLFQITYSVAYRENGTVHMISPLIDYSYVTISFLLFLTLLFVFGSKCELKFSKIGVESLFFVGVLTFLFFITGGYFPTLFKSTIFLNYWIYAQFCFIYFYIRINNNDVGSVRRALQPIFLFCLLTTIIAIAAFFNVDIMNINQTQIVSSHRMTGWLGNPNRMGNVAGIGIIIGISIYLLTARKSKAMILFNLIMVTGLVMSGSKGSILAFIVSLLILLDLRYLLRYIFWFVIIGGFVVVVNVFSGNSLLFLRILGEIVRLDSLDNGRSEIWSIMFEFWKNDSKHILFGGVDVSLSGFSAHSVYLNLLFYFGIFALFVFIIFAAYFIWINLRKEHGWGESLINRIVTSLFVYILVDGLFESLLFKLRFEFYIFLFVIALKAATSKGFFHENLLRPTRFSKKNENRGQPYA